MTQTAHDIESVLRRVAEFMDEALPFSATEETDEELISLRVLVKGYSVPKGEPAGGLIEALRELCIGVDAELNQRMSAQVSQVGEYEVEKTPPSYKSTWDHISAAEAVSERAFTSLVERKDGEIPGAVETAQTVANALVTAAGISYWRVTEGDKRGLDLRKFKQSTGDLTKPAGIILRKRQTGEPE